jgi:hypothetical protein
MAPCNLVHFHQILWERLEFLYHLLSKWRPYFSSKRLEPRSSLQNVATHFPSDFTKLHGIYEGDLSAVSISCWLLSTVVPPYFTSHSVCWIPDPEHTVLGSISLHYVPLFPAFVWLVSPLLEIFSKCFKHMFNILLSRTKAETEVYLSL